MFISEDNDEDVDVEELDKAGEMFWGCCEDLWAKWWLWDKDNNAKVGVGGGDIPDIESVLFCPLNFKTLLLVIIGEVLIGDIASLDLMLLIAKLVDVTGGVDGNEEQDDNDEEEVGGGELIIGKFVRLCDWSLEW